MVYALVSFPVAGIGTGLVLIPFTVPTWAAWTVCFALWYVIYKVQTILWPTR